MGILPFTFQGPGLLALLMSVLPAVREAAQETLARAREQYDAGRRGEELMPSVRRLDPVALSSLVPSVPTGRLARLLVDARPMGP
jgi:hypothetical protein